MIRLAFFPIALLLAVVILLFLATADTADPQAQAPATFQGKPAKWWAARAVQARKDANARKRVILRLRAQLERDSQVTPTLAIRLVFGAHADEALEVAWCESRWDAGAQNGQFLGLFQMGGYARNRYGHSSDPLTQARAAYQYFVDSGRDWSPWSCRP